MEMWITAIATGVIAIYAFMSYRLSSKIKTKDDEYRQQINDLFQAIVVSNMLSGPKGFGSTDLENRVKLFNIWYKGDIKIFPIENIYEKRG